MADLLHPEGFATGSIARTFAELPPVSWHPPGYWAVVTYPEAREVLTNYEVYSSACGTGPVGELDRTFDPATYDPALPPFRSLNFCDPPAHNQLRQHVEGWIAAHPFTLDRSVFEPLRTGGDVADSVLRGLPRQTLRAMLEIPEELAVTLQEVGLRLAYAEDSALAHEEAYKNWQQAEKDLSEALGQIPVGLGAYLPAHERLYLLRLILLASLESTTTALASLLVELATPQGWQLAQERRAHFVEEVLRLHPPLQRFGRLALRDTELGGVKIARGQRVVVFFAPANQGCPDANHLTFGAGPHRCPGMGIGRRLMRALLDACLELPLPPRIVGTPVYYWSSFQLTPREFVLHAQELSEFEKVG